MINTLSFLSSNCAFCYFLKRHSSCEPNITQPLFKPTVSTEHNNNRLMQKKLRMHAHKHKHRRTHKHTHTHKRTRPCTHTHTHKRLKLKTQRGRRLAVVQLPRRRLYRQKWPLKVFVSYCGQQLYSNPFTS